MKYLLLVFAINLFVQCASVNLVREPVTDRDRQKISKLEELVKSGLKIKNKLAIVSTKSSLPALKQYDDIIRSSTVEMVDSLGGVEIIEHRDITKMKAEYEFATKVKLNDGALNQKLGHEAGIDELFSTEDGLLKVAKYLPPTFAQIRSNFSKASSQVIYNPPVTYVDSKTKETRTTEPSWTMTVSVEINFMATSSQGKDVYSNTLTNSYSKTFPENPSPSMAHLLLPKAIEYCFEDIKPELQELFSLKTRIIALKGDLKYAMIYGGIANKIRTSRIFDVLENNIEVASLKIFKANHSDSWGTLSGDVEKVKIGSEVVLRAQKRSIFAKIWRFIESTFGL